MHASKAASDAAAEANEQMKLDSIAQTRPYVYAEIVPSLGGTDAYDLRVTNVGRTAARNLYIQFNNWPKKIDDVAEHVKILFETERTLPPGCLIRTYWRLEGNFLDGTTEAGMPKEGKIELFYGSDDPAAPQYKEQYEILRSSPVEWCNRFVSFGVGYALSWSGGSSCWVGWGVSRDLVRMSRLR